MLNALRVLALALLFSSLLGSGLVEGQGLGVAGKESPTLNFWLALEQFLSPILNFLQDPFGSLNYRLEPGPENCGGCPKCANGANCLECSCGSGCNCTCNVCAPSTPSPSCNGDGTCTPGIGETIVSCPQDCPLPPEYLAVCGDTSCQAYSGETCDNCPSDCGGGNCCGRNGCEYFYGETPLNCLQDCGIPEAPCGDDSCDLVYGETCVTCSGDCGSCCGDSTCQPWFGETYLNCDNDCDPIIGCGDDYCTTIGEDCSTCPSDCGECCGDGACYVQHGETYLNCSDCQNFACGSGTCDVILGETCLTCPGDCGGSCCGNYACEPWYGETYLNCSQDCAPLTSCGGNGCEPSKGETCLSCPLDCGPCPLPPLPPPPQLYCGDGACNPLAGETCDSCQQDCGSCISYCDNDGACEALSGESCATCLGDCGSCIPPTNTCDGDSACEPLNGESCATCPSACGSCAPTPPPPPPTPGTDLCSSDSECLSGQKCCPVFGTAVNACTIVDSYTSADNCGACGNQCGSGGNAGRPYCCPSGGTWSCSSSSCIVETPQPPSLDSCGDGICQLALEDEANCPEDCVGCNYDNSCDLLGGENCWNCGYDCYGLCLSGPSCGDGSCDALAGEACTNCAQDCGVCVGETVACSTCESCSAVLGSGKNAVIQGALGLPLILTSGSYCIDWTVPSGTTNQSLDCKGSTIKAKNAVDVYAPKSNSTLLIKNCKIDATELYSRGINYYSPSGSLNNALVLKNNTVSGQDNEGINVFRAKNIELSGNVVSNSGNGFYGGATGGAGFSENCFCENGNDVVYVYPNSSVSYSGNVCDDRFGLPAAFCAYKCESAQGIAACAEYASRNSGAFCSADSDCPLLSKCCDGVCRNTSTDALNCGACGNACATGYALGSNCVAGRCQCPIETNACDGVCVNYRTDPQNCGGCTAESEGENCLEKQEVCFTGTCGVAACTTNANCLTFGNNYKCCGKAGVVQACTNVNHNASILNCGACGNQCGSGGNAGRPYCCPSGGTFACSSAPCPPPI